MVLGQCYGFVLTPVKQGLRSHGDHHSIKVTSPEEALSSHKTPSDGLHFEYSLKKRRQSAF